jgi:Gas vesicle protein K
VTRRICLDARPEPAEKDLGAPVLTIVELLRQPMERQALRRVDGGSLTEEQIEKTGKTLMAIEDRMAELREHSGLRPEGPKARNLDLGPLG